MKSRDDLIEKISLIEKQMLLKLEEIRKTFEHKGNKGANVESEFRAFLKTYLPRRLNVGHGEIVDTQYNSTNQIDVVITDENHPFTYSDNEPGLFFIEGTCASGEIKSVLTTHELIDALDKAWRYKKLKMIPSAGATMFANDSDGKRFYTTPPFFIFAFSSQISLETISKSVYKYKSNEYYPGFSADGIFVLNKGYVIDLGDGLGAFKIYDANGNASKGWQGVYSKKLLFDFLSWLSAVMPRMQGGGNILIPYLINFSPKR